MDGFDPNDNDISTLELLTEIMHDWYQIYIIDADWYDYSETYRKDIEFVREIYETLENFNLKCC